MDMRRIPYYYYYCTSVLLWSHVVKSSTVAPPTDVTLHCHNMNNTLSWKYEQPVDRFVVLVGATARPLVKLNSSSKSIDLSEYSDPDIDGYMLMVSAVKDGAQSQRVPEDGIEYSYFMDSPARIKCSLDLPSVSVNTVKENLIAFKFTHPAVLYPTHSRLKKRKSHESHRLPMFSYHIEVLNYTESHEFECTAMECEEEVRVNGNDESYCLNISGEMRKMSVLATRTYCSSPLKPAGINPVAVIVPVVLLSAGVVILLVMLFIKRTRPSMLSPNALDFGNMNNHPQTTPSPVNSDNILVSVEAPLISEDQNTPNGGSTFTDEMRLRIGVTPHPEQREEEGDLEVEGDQEAEGDGYTQGNRLDDDDDEEEGEDCPARSSYEQRN